MTKISQNKPMVFHPRQSVEQVELGCSLAPKFDRDGLIPCVVTDASTAELLMLGYMNEQALGLTIQTGTAHYWSRSRQQLWQKGQTSGLTQKVVEMRVDDDQDAVWLRVEVEPTLTTGAASCHVGYRSCFYRSVALPTGAVAFVETQKVFEPHDVYGDAPNPTVL